MNVCIESLERRGTFYRPPTATFPSQFADGYFFADLGGGWVHFLDTQTMTETGFATGYDQPVDLKVDASGNLFVLEHGGRVHEVSVATATAAATIKLPKAGQLYRGGSTLHFRGTAEKSIKAGAFDWTVNFFQNGVDTGVVKRVHGRKAGGVFVHRANAAPGDFYEISLTVTDMSGRTTTVTRDVMPRIGKGVAVTG